VNHGTGNTGHPQARVHIRTLLLCVYRLRYSRRQRLLVGRNPAPLPASAFRTLSSEALAMSPISRRTRGTPSVRQSSPICHRSFPEPLHTTTTAAATIGDNDNERCCT
jgi:hypothetical protein